MPPSDDLRVDDPQEARLRSIANELSEQFAMRPHSVINVIFPGD